MLVTTHDGQQSNVMTISWIMVVDSTPVIAIPTVDLLDNVLGDGTFIVDGRKLTRPSHARQAAGQCLTG